jgi:Zn-finger nucleic acid-binding protein
MSQCNNCSAPLSFTAHAATVCTFCGVSNLPPPKAIAVPVPVQVVHNVVHVTAGGAPRELRCPHCKKRLAAVKVDDVTLHGCGGCGGIWIENACAQRVLAAPRPLFEELAALAATNARGRFVRAERPACPACDATLDPVTVKRIPLDICPDHGTWFDARELVLLGAALRGVVPPHAPASPMMGTVECAECRTTLDAALANVGENGPTCERCWRGRQAELVAIADAQHEQRSVGLTAGGAGALLLGLGAALLAANASRDS